MFDPTKTTILSSSIVTGFLPIPRKFCMINCFSRGRLCFKDSIVFSFIGSVTGMVVSYMIGKRIGSPAIEKYGKWVGLTSKRYEKVQKWFIRFGGWTVVFAYFIPGVRHAAGYIAGITKMSMKKYTLLCCTGALIWTELFITIGYVAGDQLSE